MSANWFHLFSPINYKKIESIKNTSFPEINEDSNQSDQLTVIREKEKIHVHQSVPSRGGSYQKVKKLSPLIGVMIKFKVYETHFL